MIHEVVEQLEKAKNGLTHAETNMKKGGPHEQIYLKAHNIATSIEQSIFGYSVMSSEKDGLIITFKERDGSTTVQKVRLKEKNKDGKLISLNPRGPISVEKTKKTEKK